MPKQKRKESYRTKKLTKLFSELEGCDEIEQKQKILEINEVVDGMNMEEFKSVFKTELYDKMNKMIEDKKLQLGNATWMLKHAGCFKALKNICNQNFDRSSLNKRFEEMIRVEVKKKEKKNEKLLANLSECYFLLNGNFSPYLLSICVPYVLKAASKKEEDEETQNEVEIALLALFNMGFCFILRELYMKEITEIIKHQQKHRNLTKLSYQCAWRFLIDQLLYNENVEEVIVNVLHFGREAAREFEELTGCIDWKRKEGMEIGEEAKDELILTRWLQTVGSYFLRCKLENKEFVGLFSSIVQLYQISRDNYILICNQCIYSLINAAERRVVKVEDLLNGGAVNTLLGEMKQPTLKRTMEFNFLLFFLNITERLKEKEDNEMEEEERKITKRKVFEKMEEEGYEDAIICFHRRLVFFNKNYYRFEFSSNISDYLVNV